MRINFSQPPPFIIIAGPTASGKSALSMEVAQILGCEIISADSMMVYRGMDIGTAKPDPKSREIIPHYLIDIINPDEHFDTASFRYMAIEYIKKIADSQKIPLVVGGTGLYIRSLFRGLVEAPPRNENLRNMLMCEAEKKGKNYLYEKLVEIDPESALKIHKNDLTRIIRAIEIFTETGIKASSLRQAHGFKQQYPRSLYLVIDIPKEEVKKRIRERAESMVRTGLIDEVKELLKKGFSETLKPMKALNYRHAIKFLKGKLNKEELIHEMATDTWHFCRRQFNWFSSEQNTVYIEPRPDKVIKLIKDFLT